MLNMFKKYEALSTSNFGTCIFKLRCDNGGEYTSKEFIKFCDYKGIQIQYTTPYTPQQNGHAERLNRTLTDKCRAILLDSGLPKEMWNEGVRTAVYYLLNRSPTVALKDKTPAEVWYGKKPNVGHLRVFGCQGYLLQQKHKRNKFDAKSKLYLLIGYTDHGYRLWDTVNCKVVVGRNVTFNEELDLNNKTFIQIKQPAKQNDIQTSRLIILDTLVCLEGVDETSKQQKHDEGVESSPPVISNRKRSL